MVTMIKIPEYSLGALALVGKCGSGMPVMGFLSTVGANAANVGRGRSTSDS